MDRFDPPDRDERREREAEDREEAAERKFDAGKAGDLSGERAAGEMHRRSVEILDRDTKCQRRREGLGG